MPHLVILYTGNLEAETDMSALCRTLADTLLQARDEDGLQVFPTGGIRVLAYPAPHYAVADGTRDYGFVYLNLRMGRGRSDLVRKEVGDQLLSAARTCLAPVFDRRHVGLTLQIDIGPEVFDGKHSNIHPLFRKD